MEIYYHLTWLLTFILLWYRLSSPQKAAAYTFHMIYWYADEKKKSTGKLAESHFFWCWVSMCTRAAIFMIVFICKLWKDCEKMPVFISQSSNSFTQSKTPNLKMGKKWRSSWDQRMFYYFSLINEKLLWTAVNFFYSFSFNAWILQGYASCSSLESIK